MYPSAVGLIPDDLDEQRVVGAAVRITKKASLEVRQVLLAGTPGTVLPDPVLLRCQTLPMQTTTR